MPAVAPAKRLLLVGLTAVFIAALLIYWPGLGGSFVLDDEANIVRNEQIHLETLSARGLWTAAWSGPGGLSHRPLSNLTFALNYYVTGGLDPFHYKFTNVILHALNGVAIGVLTWLLLSALQAGTMVSRAWIAVAVAAIWVVHPLNLTPALYVVQRMTSLAALFTICGAITYVKARSRLLEGKSAWPWFAATFLFFLPCAASSKETGILLLLYILVIEGVVFRLKTVTPRQRVRLLWGLVAAVGVPIGIVAAFTAISSVEWYTHGYAGRDFTPSERLLTQSRIVSWYLRMILLPSATETGLTLDDFGYSRSLLDPASTLAAVALLSALAALGIGLRDRAPIVSLGILWFFVGHTLESTILPLEMAFEHRNYLPSLGPILILVYYAVASPTIAKTRAILLAGLSAYVTLLAASTVVRADQWSHPERLLMMELEHRPKSSRNQALAAEHFAARATNAGEGRSPDFDRAVYHYGRSLELDPQALSSMLGLMVLYQACQQPEPDDLWGTIVAAAGGAPITASAVNALGGLTRCIVDGYCSLSGTKYLALANAMLVNSSNTPANRALMLTYVSEHAAGKERDLEAALAYTERAISLRPDDSLHRFQRLRWLTLAGRYDETQGELAEIRRRDWLGIWTQAADDWERALQERRRVSRKPETPSGKRRAAVDSRAAARDAGGDG